MFAGHVGTHVAVGTRRSAYAAAMTEGRVDWARWIERALPPWLIWALAGTLMATALMAVLEPIDLVSTIGNVDENDNLVPLEGPLWQIYTLGLHINASLPPVTLLPLMLALVVAEASGRPVRRTLVDDTRRGAVTFAVAVGALSLVLAPVMMTVVALLGVDESIVAYFPADTRAVPLLSRYVQALAAVLVAVAMWRVWRAPVTLVPAAQEPVAPGAVPLASAEPAQADPSAGAPSPVAAPAPASDVIWAPPRHQPEEAPLPVTPAAPVFQRPGSGAAATDESIFRRPD